MNRIKRVLLIMICFGFFSSLAIAGENPSNAKFFYGVTVDAQGKTTISDRPIEADLKGKKEAVALPDDILAPENFYGYSDL